MARLEREAREREEQRRQEERKEIQRRAAREKLDQLMATPVGARVFEGMDEAVSLKCFVNYFGWILWDNITNSLLSYLRNFIEFLNLDCFLKDIKN